MEMAGNILKPIENGTTFEFKFSHMVSLYSLALPYFSLFPPSTPFPSKNGTRATDKGGISIPSRRCWGEEKGE